MESQHIEAQLKWALAIAAMMLILLAPALWNGFPLVFADTGGYLARAFERTLDIGRSALYGVFLRAGSGLYFWPNVVAQAGATVWLILLTLRTHGLGNRPALALAVVALLAALTGLPWFVGQLMPDILLPLSVLSMHLLAFRWLALRKVEIAALIVIIALAIAAHMSTLGLCIGLVAALAILRKFGSWLRLERPRLDLTSAATAAGIALALLSNLAIANSFSFTPGGPTFLFGRLIQDGIIARYLVDRCPDPTIQLCAYRDQMPTGTDGWLWDYESPLHKLGWWRGYEPEARRIIGETLRMYPGAHIKTGLKATFDQLIALNAGEGMHSRDNAHTEGTLARWIPDAADRFRKSGQQRNAFGFSLMNAVQTPLALFATFTLPLLVLLGYFRRISPPVATFALTVFLALLGNAAISGFFSNPNNRYQNRIVWLAPLALAVAIIGERARRDHGRQNTAS